MAASCRFAGLALLCAAPLFASPSHAAPPDQQVAPVAWLLEQIRIGEAAYRYDLVAQSLYRLQKIAPRDPRTIAAQIRLALHQGEQDKARKLLQQLQQQAPDDEATRLSALSLRLTTPEARRQLQQARLFATAGRLTAAKAQYDALLGGDFPTPDLAREYWSLTARLPGQRPLALQQLQALDRRYPGSVGIGMTIARLHLSAGQTDQALEQLRRIARSSGRQDAAELWLATIKAQPVSDASVAALKQYLDTFTGGAAQANGQAELQRQQALLADPAYRQRQRGLALLARGAGAGAIAPLRAALRTESSDADLLGAMGLAQSRASNHAAAISYFERAIRQGGEVAKWQSLLRINRYWQAIDNGSQALKQGDVAGAERQYQLARRLDGRDGYALVGLGDVAQARQQNAQAEQLYQQALELEADNTTAIRRLAVVYESQSPQRSLNFLDGLSAAARRALGSSLPELRASALSANAAQLAQRGDWPQAAARYQQAQRETPDDVWLNYHLAEALRQIGQPRQADALMEALARRLPDDSVQAYAHALYLSASDRPRQALQQLNQLPQARWNDDIRALANRLAADQLIERAAALREAGNEPAAIALLEPYSQQQPPSPRIILTLADWALARGNAPQALRLYSQLHHDDDAAIGAIDALLTLNRRDEARQQLQTLDPQQGSLNRGRRLANDWQTLGEPQKAAAIFDQLKPKARREMPSLDSALLFRDAARQEAAEQPRQALADYAQAMAASGIAVSPPKDNDSFTRLTRNDRRDDWLKRGIRSDAADLYRRQDTTVTLEEDYSRNSGTGGISDFSAWTTMLQVNTPLGSGQGFLRLDQVNVSAGDFSTANGRYKEVFGTCANSLNGCDSGLSQRAQGVSPAVGWTDDRWSADIGTTPLGFEVVNWVGGVTRKLDAGDLGVSLTASRRPIASSLLAYAGAVDPNSGKSWGGVVATGGAVGLSYDRGGPNGVWADISAHQLTGKNVADNSRERLMAGYYYKFINEDNQRATIGLNSMLWHYQKDLSDYAFGQGGYYSPQSYFSLAVPVTWRKRTDNWSFDLGASLSWSRSHTSAQRRYPVDPGVLLDDNPLSDASSSSGVGYTLLALVERRLSSHWTLGVGFDIQQAKDYTPSHGLLYLTCVTRWPAGRGIWTCRRSRWYRMRISNSEGFSIANRLA